MIATSSDEFIINDMYDIESGITRLLTLSRSRWPRSTSLTLKYCSLSVRLNCTIALISAIVLDTSVPFPSPPSDGKGNRYNFGKLKFRCDKRVKLISIFIRDKQNCAIIDIKYSSSFYLEWKLYLIEMLSNLRLVLQMSNELSEQNNC
jgi:hypothetical protein